MVRSFIFLLFPFMLCAQQSLPYNVGEAIEYNVTFKGINVGSATLTVEQSRDISNNETYQITGKGKTAPFFDIFFKVRDVYKTYLDAQEVRPIRFIRDIYEGGFEKKQKYNFFHQEGIVRVKDTSYKITPNTQDMLSALFYARTFSTDSLKKGKVFEIPIFMDEENFILEITYLGTELLDTKFGKIPCLVFKPKMQAGRVFEDGEKMKIWISDDKNKILFKVVTEIWAGDIVAELTEFKNLKYRLKKVI